MMIAAVLATTACGGASESPAGTDTSPSESVAASVDAARAAVEVSADALISAMGDARAAVAAVLLSSDLGYGVDQIVSAGVENRLQPDGSILSGDGEPLTPDTEPSGLLDDDVTGNPSEASGLRSPPRRIPLSSLLNHHDDRVNLVSILLFLEFGYSLEQVVLALLAGDSWTPGTACLEDGNGNVVEPEQSPQESWVGWCRATTTTTTSATSTAPGVTTLDATEPAAGPGGEGSSDADPLSGTWTMWWINDDGSRSDAFTIRFNGAESGTLEILNDETEIDTFFTVDGDLVTLGFTRLQALDPKYYTQESVADISFFIGEFEDGNSIDGLWEREGYSCSPDGHPQCVLGTDPISLPAGLVRDN